MNHYTETNDTSDRAYSERNDRANGGDWPTGNGYHWRCNDRPPRRQHRTYWRHGGLRSLINWNRAIKRERAGLWMPMNIDPPKGKAA